MKLLPEIITALNLMITPEAFECLTLNAYHEARGESSEGIIAVSHVVLNRVLSREYPDKVCDVVYQPYQFSWTNDDISDIPSEQHSWETVQYLTLSAMALYIRGDDYSDGSKWYHAKHVSPKWSQKASVTADIGNHIFFAKLE